MKIASGLGTEQRAIGHVLGTLDDKIELNRRMNETLEEMARALFKSWFVDFEPVRAKMDGCWRRGESLPGLPAEHYDLFPDRLVPSELGDIPEGWEVRQFSDIATQLRDNENPTVSPDIEFSHFSIPAYDEGQTPKLELGADIKSTKSRVPQDTVLLSKLNPEIKRVWLVDIAPDERAICSTEFLVLKARPPFQSCYVYCLALSPFFRQQIESIVTGTSKSHQRAPANAILSLEAAVPPAQVIKAFQTSASGLLQRSMTLRRESRDLAAQRDGLLPGLVSGKFRWGKLTPWSVSGGWMYTKRVQIVNYGPIDRLDITLPFEGDSPKPVLLVGENGSGKSILLSHIVNGLVSAKDVAYPETPEVETGRVYKLRRQFLRQDGERILFRAD